jgi:16S rRNA (adenine1518-N6/adenine1519-N6)-dimethyltransferase
LTASVGGVPAADFPDPRALLRRYGLRPNKRLGQHFLIERSVLTEILAAAEVTSSDTVLEIGPGLGLLTAALAERAGRVVAVELDPLLRGVLLQLLGLRPNVEIVTADILQADPPALLGLPHEATGRWPGYKVVANLPYNITSAVLRQILEARVQPERAVVMVQKEVAERIVAGPGDMSVLAVAVQFYATPSLVTIVPAASFHPPPKVDSAVLRLDVRATPRADVPDVAAFFRVVRAGFGQKRKQLKNSLAAGLELDGATTATVLATAGIDGTRRAETLTLAEWATLTRKVSSSAA